jgi:hypothetical protein
MKHTFLICCILLYYLPLKAQLKVDAGNDVIVCSGDNNGEYKIGGSPTASSDVEPYTYTWSGKHFDLKYPTGEPMWIYASDIMDDTTKGNPVIKDWRNVPDEWTTYYLKVEDAVGNVQVDSVKIIESVFFIHAIYKLPETIYRGDSVRLFGDIYFVNNFVPLEYTLSPSHGLTDSTNINGWAKPDTSITYYLQAVNSVGCSSPKIKYWRIDVIDTTSAIGRELIESEVQCYLQNGSILIKWSDGNVELFSVTVTDLNGQLIHAGNYNEQKLILSDLRLKENKVYLVSVVVKGQIFTYKLFNG